MAWVLRGPLRIDPQLRALRDVAWFVAAVVALSTWSSPIGYVAVYTAAGRIPPSDVVGSALQFWVGDTLGILVTTPVPSCSSLRRRTRARRPPVVAKPCRRRSP